MEKFSCNSEVKSVLECGDSLRETLETLNKQISNLKQLQKSENYFLLRLGLIAFYNVICRLKHFNDLLIKYYRLIIYEEKFFRGNDNHTVISYYRSSKQTLDEIKESLSLCKSYFTTEFIGGIFFQKESNLLDLKREQDKKQILNDIKDIYEKCVAMIDKLLEDGKLYMLNYCLIFNTYTDLNHDETIN